MIHVILAVTANASELNLCVDAENPGPTSPFSSPRNQGVAYCGHINFPSDYDFKFASIRDLDNFKTTFDPPTGVERDLIVEGLHTLNGASNFHVSYAGIDQSIAQRFPDTHQNRVYYVSSHFVEFHPWNTSLAQDGTPIAGPSALGRVRPFCEPDYSRLRELFGFYYPVCTAITGRTILLARDISTPGYYPSSLENAVPSHLRPGGAAVLLTSTNGDLYMTAAHEIMHVAGAGHYNPFQGLPYPTLMSPGDITGAGGTPIIDNMFFDVGSVPSVYPEVPSEWNHLDASAPVVGRFRPHLRDRWSLTEMHGGRTDWSTLSRIDLGVDPIDAEQIGHDALTSTWFSVADTEYQACIGQPLSDTSINDVPTRYSPVWLQAASGGAPATFSVEFDLICMNDPFNNPAGAQEPMEGICEAGEMFLWALVNVDNVPADNFDPVEVLPKKGGSTFGFPDVVFHRFAGQEVDLPEGVYRMRARVVGTDLHEPQSTVYSDGTWFLTRHTTYGCGQYEAAVPESWNWNNWR